MKTLKPEHLMFMQNLINPANNGKIVCKNGVDTCVAMGILRIFCPDDHLIDSRIVPNKQTSNISNLISSMITGKKLYKNSYYLIIGGTLSEQVCKDIDRINQMDLSLGGEYKVLFVPSRTHDYVYQYDWVIGTNESITVSEDMRDLMYEYDRTQPRGNGTKLQQLFRANGKNPIDNIDALIAAAKAYSYSDMSKLEGKLALQLSTLINGIRRSKVSEFIYALAECMVGTLFNKTEVTNGIEENDPDKFIVNLPAEYVNQYYDLLSVVHQQVNMMDRFSFRADYTDMVPKTENLNVSIVFGVDGCTSAHPATLWLRKHPSVDILIAWDLRKPDFITFRTIKDIKVSEIAQLYFSTDVKSIGTLGMMDKMVRLRFNPTSIVITGNVAGKERGFGGSRVQSTQK